MIACDASNGILSPQRALPLRYRRLRNLKLQTARRSGESANSAFTRPRLKGRRFSVLPGLTRLSRHMPECATRFLPWSPTCASLPEALPWHRQELPSSIRSAQVENLLLLRSWLPPGQATLECHLSPAISRKQRANHFPARISQCFLISAALRREFLAASITMAISPTQRDNPHRVLSRSRCFLGRRSSAFSPSSPASLSAATRAGPPEGCLGCAPSLVLTLTF